MAILSAQHGHLLIPPDSYIKFLWSTPRCGARSHGVRFGKGPGPAIRSRTGVRREETVGHSATPHWTSKAFFKECFLGLTHTLRLTDMKLEQPLSTSMSKSGSVEHNTVKRIDLQKVRIMASTLAWPLSPVRVMEMAMSFNTDLTKPLRGAQALQNGWPRRHCRAKRLRRLVAAHFS